MASVVGRAAFGRLRTDGRRYRRGTIRCRHVPTDTTSRRAFAIGRGFGPAVDRNRARRRIDAAIHEVQQETEVPRGDYLFTCDRAILTVEFVQLRQNIEQLFGDIAHASPIEKTRR